MPRNGVAASHLCALLPEDRSLAAHHFEANLPIAVRGLRFSSLSEAAAAFSLEIFIPGFQLQPKQNFQVPLAHGRSIDFIVNDTVVEYHHLRMKGSKNHHGDFTSWRAYSAFRERFTDSRNRGRKERAALLSKTRESLYYAYRNKRRALLNNEVAFAAKELVVVTSPVELFRDVLSRFGETGGHTPETFTEVFFSLRKELAKEVTWVKR